MDNLKQSVRRHCIVLVVQVLIYFYHPPTKLWEGNIFSNVCLSVCLFTSAEGLLTITNNALDSLYRDPPNLVPPRASDIWWPSMETCSILFTSGPPQLVLTPVAIEAHTVGASGQYASYWNTFLYFNTITIKKMY